MTKRQIIYLFCGMVGADEGEQVIIEEWCEDVEDKAVILWKCQEGWLHSGRADKERANRGREAEALLLLTLRLEENIDWPHE